MKLKTFLVDLPRWQKRVLVLSCDVALCIVSAWIAFYLRTGVFHALHGRVVLSILLSIGLAVPIFVFSGLYRAIFRYEGFGATVAIAQAMLMYSLLYFILITLVNTLGIAKVPKTIGIIQPIVLFIGLVISRWAARYWLANEYKMQMRNARLPRVLIYGAGNAGRQLASVLVEAHQMLLVGFLDDDKALQGLLINGIKVYPPKDVEKIAGRFAVKTVLLAIPSASANRRKEIISSLVDKRLEVKTLPALAEIATGEVKVSTLKQVSIEELLGRDPVEPLEDLLQGTIRDKVVMVTGAGGSIGSELCRQILRIRPKTLLLVERAEYSLYAIDMELREQFGKHGVPVYPLLADVRDEARMREIMTAWGVNTVYHAAAYKHVPMVERNPMEGIVNNVFGTMTAAKVARDCGVERFTLISTDKAVRPTNVMGATKRLCELILQSMAAESKGKTVFTMVRFGNVLGSSGSVVPRFRKQIQDGGPVTVTHQDITRYFMTIPEASQLVVQAASLGTGGDVFLLDMGEPVKIIELARKMVKLSGLTVKDDEHPKGDIEIVVTGLRPGEKLYEELLVAGDPSPTKHPRIFYAKEVAKPREDLLAMLDSLRKALEKRDRREIREILMECVPEYAPKDGVMDWVALQEGEI